MGTLADALVQKGYNMTDALNAEKGPRAVELSREYLGGSTQSSSQPATSSSGGDFNSYLQQQQSAQQAALAPAIQSLQAGLPTIAKNYQTQIGQKQAEIQPLQDRYKSLLDQIKGVGQTSVNKQTVVTANELGKRGIEGSSTLAGQEIASATLPIEQQTQSLVKDTCFAQEADIRDINNQVQNLGGQQTEKEQAVQQAIAQLQAGGGQQAVQNALALLNNAQQMEASSAAAQSSQRQQDIENALAQAQLQNETANTNSLIADRAKTSSGGDNITNTLKTIFGQGQNASSSDWEIVPQSTGSVLPQSAKSMGKVTGSYYG
jgi:hypothetical protein